MFSAALTALIVLPRVTFASRNSLRGSYDVWLKLVSFVAGEKYDFLRDRWLEIPNMHTPRSNFAVAVLDDLLFAIGGFNGE